MKIKKVCVITATRAEYGLLLPLLKLLEKNTRFELMLFVTGTHLSYEFGFTKNEILDDGFQITEEIDCIVANDTPNAVGKTAGLAIIGFVDGLQRHKPDIIVILGDRYEALCAALAANICQIPVAHLHGGEKTEGSFDDNFRHAITKLSHLHFTSTEEYRRRVLQMGEQPEHIFNVGAIGLDNIKNVKPLSRKILEKKLNIKFKDKNLLITIHPETLSPGSSGIYTDLLLESLKEFKDVFILFTGANADPEGRIINQKLKEYTNNHTKCHFIENLGLLNYISVLNIVDLVIGNSSSGIIEVPSFSIKTINIGNRQHGRIRAQSVIDVDWNKDEIRRVIKENISKSKKKYINPYGDGNTAERIINELEKIKNTDVLLKKNFIDFME